MKKLVFLCSFGFFNLFSFVHSLAKEDMELDEEQIDREIERKIDAKEQSQYSINMIIKYAKLVNKDILVTPLRDIMRYYKHSPEETQKAMDNAILIVSSTVMKKSANPGVLDLQLDIKGYARDFKATIDKEQEEQYNLLKRKEKVDLACKNIKKYLFLVGECIIFDK